MAEEPEVKVVEFEDTALFEIDGNRYELNLEDSHLIHEIDKRLAKIPASRYDMKEFTITVPYLFEVPELNKYLNVDLSIACQPWDNRPDSYYVSTNLGIEQAYLRDKRENERVEEEKVVIDGDFERVDGFGDSYAIKQHDNWVVYGAYDVIDDPDAADHDSITYKIKNLDNFSELAGDVPVYVSSSSLDFSQGTSVFDKDHMASARDMDQQQLKSVFITKDQVLKDAAKILETNDFPTTQHNQEWLAKEMIKRAGASHYGIESDIAYTNNEIAEQLKHNVFDEFYTQLDGFYLDPRIEDNKNKVVDIDDGRTLNELTLAVYHGSFPREHDYSLLIDELKSAELPLLNEQGYEYSLQGDGNSYAQRINGKWYVVGATNVDPSLPESWETYRLEDMTSKHLASLPDDAPIFTTAYVFEDAPVSVARVKPDNADYVTKKLLMAQTKELLENLEFPTTDKNLNKMAQELLYQGNYGGYDAGTYDMVAWSDSIEDSFLNDYHTLQHSQLDGFYNDPQIEKVKNQKLVEDSNADMGVLFEGETITDFITAQHVYTEARSLDYKQLNKEMERAGLERLDHKRLTPKFEAVIDGRPQVLSERDVISRALNTLQQKYESDRAMETAVDYLRNPNLNSPKKRLKLAAKVLENVDHVKLYKLGKERPITAPKPVIKKKAKER